jgi:hypothetical protein
LNTAVPEDEKFILWEAIVNQILLEADREFFSSGEKLSTIYEFLQVSTILYESNKSIYKEENMLTMKNVHGLELNHQYIPKKQSVLFDLMSCEVQKYRL